MRSFPQLKKRLLQLLLPLLTTSALAAEANRLTYLDDNSPFWPGPATPKLTTPQWIGEPGVDAVVIIAIDDMREAPKYEAFLRPILDRLKQIDGRAPVSIMTNTVPPSDPQFVSWLGEGLSIESHTLTHPCPLLGKADFAEASRTYQESVDLLARIPGNQPVAFRMPCCDSMNSASPRFYSEIFSQASPAGHHLSIDSSVFMLPPGGQFRKYFPAEMRPPMKRSLADYAGFVKDYPYPYVFGKSAWEFPCMTPSDWEAFNVLGPKSAEMLADWKAALDYVVQKQGVFTTVFHPHGWSDPAQWVDFIDYAQRTYGGRVKFLNFREALARLEKHALGDHSLQNPLGSVRLLDLDGDGYMDVIAGGADHPGTRVWSPAEKRWIVTGAPFDPRAVSFAIVRDKLPSALSATAAWTWKSGAWQPDELLAKSLPSDSGKGRLFRDFDADGTCELLANRDIFAWDEKAKTWHRADFALPAGCALLDDAGRENGLRFADLNGDGFDDLLQSNDSGYSIHLWAGTVKANLGWTRGWPHLVAQGPSSTDPTHAKLLPFVHAGRDYGAWIHGSSIIWQNEDVVTTLTESVTRTFQELIAFPTPAPKSPAESLAALRPRPGFTVELVASEPLIESPVAFDWDAQGRLWVVEMRDYPLGLDGKGKPGGIVKILTDTDGDGRYDHAETFLEDIPFPNSILPWRNGVIIASAPEIFFAADLDGDGRADERRVLFTGFKQGNQQHRLNGFDLGLDGWLYGANGDSGGVVSAPGHPERKAVSISGRDFRFQPDSGDFEPESGGTQFGRHRDDWGHWFGNNNSTWLWHYTIADHDLRRNPKLAVKTTKRVLANYPDASRVFPVSELPIRFNQPQSLGHLTSGCSPAPYRDGLFGPAFADSIFISEPVHNLVHREVLVPEGASFTSHRAGDEMDREFLASTDAWFRPTTIKTGPDGALYIADFYRFVLEHPEWIAPETQSRLDLRAGADRGRIYRIFSTGAKLRPVPNLAALTGKALAAALDSPNGWQRDTVQRLLTERGHPEEATPELRSLAAKAAHPKVRVQALATLARLSALEEADLLAALHDRDSHVRIQALQESEGLAAPGKEIVDRLASLADDPEFTVRHQLALSLGAFHDPRALAALERLAERDGSQPEMRIAIESSLAPESPLFAKLSQPFTPTSIVPVPLPKSSNPDRAKVVADFASVSSLATHSDHGHIVFQQQCALCHQRKGEGHEVGPDLAVVTDKPTDWLLTAIFDPNAAIEDRYKGQSVKLRSGSEFLGLISAETANNIVVRLPGGTELPVLRADIAEQKGTGRSLMPEGLENILKPQDVADLISWLREP